MQSQLTRNLCAVVALVASAGLARADDRASLITVSGNAEIKVAPDEVAITLGVESFAKQLADARQDNDARAARVLAFLREAGLGDEQVRTDHISARPRTRIEHGQHAGVFIDGYEVRKTLVAVMSDLTQFERVLSGALDAGATHVHDVNFRTTRLREHRDAARAAAIRAAREKAVALAGELGESIGRAHMIREDRVGWYDWYGFGWGGGGQWVMQNVSLAGGPGLPEGGSAVAIGRISVTASVTVSFALAEPAGQAGTMSEQEGDAQAP